MAVPVPLLRGAAALNGVVIAGGGPAGASAACLLAKAGRRVTLLERDAGPQHKMCGEFISGEAIASLHTLGIDIAAHGAAPIASVRLIHRERVAESRLPFAAAGLSRRALDELLLARAACLGTELHRGVRVRAADAAAVQTDQGELPAETVFLATGKRDLHGMRRELPRPMRELIGLKIHLRLAPAQREAVRGCVEVVGFSGGYGGLQLIEQDTANLCVLVDGARFSAGASGWHGMMTLLAGAAPHLARRLDGATPLFDRPLTISRVPYGYVYQAADEPGPFRLGDQAAVIPSFCGDGMAIALHSGRLAAEAVLRGEDASVYHRRLRRDAGPPVRLADRLYRLSSDGRLRALLVEAARMWPGLLRTLARHTRVSDRRGFNGPERSAE